MIITILNCISIVFLLSLFEITFSIYGTTLVFYSQLCQLGTINPTSSSNYPITTLALQQNIVRTGIALSQFSKSTDEYHSFSATVSAASATTSSFTITVSLANPSDGMKMSFFLLVIKQQSSIVYIDLVTFAWNSVSSINNNNWGDRDSTQSISLTTQTLFATVPSTITSIALVTSFRMFPKTWSGDYINWKWNDFKLTSWISGTTLNANLRAYSETKISGFHAVVLVFSTGNLASENTAKGWNMSLVYQGWTDPSIYTMTSFAPNFGPSFNKKCLFGFFRVNYKGSKSFTYQFTNTANGNYTLMDLPDSLELYPEGFFFCFGNQSSECGQTQTLFDNVSLTCHGATLCPLKQFSTWTNTAYCPLCAQLICKNCTPSNRLNCLTCGTNSTLSGGVCVCNTDCWPFNTSISTSAEGLWGGTAVSLTQCRYNCTAQIIGCVFDKCDTGTFCTQCLTGFYLDVTGSTTNQACVACTTLFNCIECTNAVTCTLCIANYFPVTGVCTLCGGIITNCDVCTDASTCNTCDLGYAKVAPNQCTCSPTINGMNNCNLCTLPTACDQCVSQMFFINVTDSMCHSCRNFDPFCITCTAENVCLSCDPGYTVVTTGTNSLCKACWDLFPNCTLCSSPTACDSCNNTYGLTTSFECEVCTTLLMPGCQSCTDSTACQLCVNDTHLLNGKCVTCDTIMHCVECFVNSIVELQCLLCVDGYYINVSALTGKPQCRACMHFTDYCNTCNNSQCLSCVYPYLVGSDGLCSKCQPGFYYISGICTNIAGCIRAAYLPNGTTTCIACAAQLFYVFDEKQRKCLCMEGFKDFNSIGLLPQCRPVCGDGIIVSQFQECDDNNTANQDGCNSLCKEQPGYDCGFSQPSKCLIELDITEFKFNYVSRVLGQNKGIISFTILPGHSGLSRVQWDQFINLKFPSNAVAQNLISYSYTTDTGELRITVPYNEELQGTVLQSELTLDPEFIKSKTPFLALISKLNGINAKLIFQDLKQLQTHKNIDFMTQIMTILLLLVFYAGSYVHKMIGLETIQIVQAIYFVRMIAPSSSSSLLSSVNGLQYATSGYQNPEWIYGDVSKFEGQLNAFTTQQFTAINLNKLFIFNANLTFIPVFLALFVYAIVLARKYHARNQYMQNKQQQFKDKYTQLQRSSQWIYDHFVFPYCMMFNLLNFFQIVSLLSVPFKTDLTQLKSIQTQSFIAHTFMVLCATSIYCYEISASYQEYAKFRMTEKQRQRVPKSMVEQLEHDQNNNDRANYHPAYVLCNLVYYFLLSVIMIFSVIVPEFTYSLEFTSGIAFIYFVYIWIWSPYHSSISSHNHCLKIYNGVFCTVLVVCNLFVRLPKLSGTIYATFVYLIVSLLGIIVVIGFIRIVLELKFRKALEQNSGIMQWKANQDLKEPLTGSQNLYAKQGNCQKTKTPGEQKLQAMLKKNNYTLDNQLLEMQKKSQNPQSPKGDNKLSYDEKRYLMKKVKQDIQQQKINNIVQKISTKEYHRIEYQRMTPVNRNTAVQNNDGSKNPFVKQQNLIHKIIQEKKDSTKVVNVHEKKFLKDLKQKLRAQWAIMEDQ